MSDAVNQKLASKKGPGRPRNDDRMPRLNVVPGLAAGEAKEVVISGGNLAVLQRVARANDATISDAAVAILLPIIGRKIKGATSGASVGLTLPPALWTWVDSVGGIDAALKLAGVESY